MMDALVAWLREQLDEDERAVERSCIHVDDCNESGYGDQFDDARVLAEVEAKRRIIAIWENAMESYGADAAEEAVRVLAQVYASRPGFKDEWRLT